MLSPEAAAKQLEQWQHDLKNDMDDGAWRLVALAGKLPKPGRAVAYCLFDLDSNGKEPNREDWSKTQKQKIDTFTEFDSWSKAQRLRWFEHFLPKLAEDLENSWQHLKSTPYMRGYARRSFRTPNDPGPTLEKRTAWLKRILGIAGRHRTEVITAPWLATWAAHLKQRWSNWQDEIGQLLAGVLHAGGPKADEVFGILSESLCNQHEIGAMGRHITRALLLSPRPDGWELMEKTLLAAQRQEGLRQVLLETVDEAHPEAFRRMLRIIQEQDLVRFSAVVRAVNVWLGYAWDSQSVKTINEVIDRCRRLLANDADRPKALLGKDAEEAYLALWAMAFDDAQAAIAATPDLLRHSQVEHRYAAARFLTQTDLPEAKEPLMGLLDDADLRVAYYAMQRLTFGVDDGVKDSFERLERLYHRVPEKPTELKPLIWPWTALTVDRSQITKEMFQALVHRPPTRLLPYLASLSSYQRSRMAALLSEQNRWDSVTRTTLFDLAGDAAADVRKSALDALAKQTLQDGEAEHLEGYLTRKASDLRRGVIGILGSQKDNDAFASADRLLGGKDAQLRLAGLELLRQLGEAKRQLAGCQERAENYRSTRKKLTK